MLVGIKMASGSTTGADGRSSVFGMEIVAGVIALILIGYLLITLIYPEKF